MHGPVGYPPCSKASRTEGTRDAAFGVLTSWEAYGTFLPPPEPRGFSGWVSTHPFPYGVSLSARYPPPE